MDDLWKTVCSLMAAFSLLLNLLPWPLRQKIDLLLRNLWKHLFSSTDPFACIRIPSTSDSALHRLHATSSSSSSSAAAAAAAAYALDSYHYDLHSPTNPLYDDVCLYISSLDVQLRSKHVDAYGLLPSSPASSSSTDAAKTSPFFFGLPPGHTLDDTFRGVHVWWTHTTTTTDSSSSSSIGGGAAARTMHTSPASASSDHRVFILTMLNSDKPRLLQPYLIHISETAASLREHNKLLTYYTNRTHGIAWSPFLFKHPSTFDTIALPDDLAERIRADLVAFSESEEFYHSIGRAWKRGYLLYGPPGTGKSSLIAAMANFLHYDIYELELTNVYTNTDLKGLLMRTTRRSIVVIEDIDTAAGIVATVAMSNDDHADHEAVDDDEKGCSYSRSRSSNNKYDDLYDEHAHGGKSSLTLSGLLSFADGLMSSFGEERIFVFTTNHRERLDAALLRCGRMDMHILLSYCSFAAMKKLAFNYLQGITEHPLFAELERALPSPSSRGEGEVELTPASVAEILIRNRRDPDEALRQVLAAAKSAPVAGSGCRKQELARTVQGKVYAREADLM